MSSKHNTRNCMWNRTFGSSSVLRTCSLRSSPLGHCHPLKRTDSKPRSHSWPLSFPHLPIHWLYLLGPPSKCISHITISYHWHSCCHSLSHPCLFPSDSSHVLSSLPPLLPPLPASCCHPAIVFSNNESHLVSIQFRSCHPSVQNSSLLPIPFRITLRSPS